MTDPATQASSQDIHKEKILILDFGSQYTQLIARRVREVGVYCEIHPIDFPIESAREFAPQGIILSGGNVDPAVFAAAIKADSNSQSNP